MQTPNIQNRFQECSEREARLLLFAPPVPKGPDKRKKAPDIAKRVAAPMPGIETPVEQRNRIERQKPRWATAEKQLDIAASWNPKLHKLISDPQVKRMILAQLDLRADKSVDWLPRTAMTLVEKYHESFANAEEELQDLKKRVNGEMRDYLDKIIDGLEDLRNIADTYRENGGGKLPNYEGGGGMRKLMDDRKDREREFSDQRNYLIDVAKLVIDAPDPAEAEGALRVLAKKNEFQTTIARNVTDILSVPNTWPSMQEKVLNMLKKNAHFALSEAEKKKVEATISIIDSNLTQLTQDRDVHMLQRFKEATQYWTRMGGSDEEAMLLNAVTEPDFRFSMTLLEENIKVLLDIDSVAAADKTRIENMALNSAKFTSEGADKLKDKYGEVINVNLLQALLKNGKSALQSELARLNASRAPNDKIDLEDFAEDLIDAWDTKDLQRYLRENMSIKNGVGVSLSALVLQARMPKMVADDMVKSKLKLDVSDAVTFAKIDVFTDADGTFSADTAKAITEILSRKRGANRIVKKEHFHEVFSYLLFDTRQTPLEQSGRDARVAAETLWNTFISTGVIKQQGDNSYLITGNLAGAFDAVQAGKEAVKHVAEMRAAEIHKVHWRHATGMYISEIAKTIEYGGKTFGDYVLSLPGAYFDSSKNRDLSQIIKKRGALNDYRDILKDMLEGSNDSRGTEGRFAAALERLKDMQKNRAGARDRLNPANDFKDHVQQAEYLMKANAMIIEELRSNDQWDTYSREMRQVSLWIAMHRKDGVEQAKLYLRDPGSFMFTSEEEEAIALYIGRFDALKILEGKDALAPLNQEHNISVRPMALQALAELQKNEHRNSRNIDRWADFREEDPESVAEAMSVVLQSPPGIEGSKSSKAALIDAFVNKRDATYLVPGSSGPIEKVITANHAFTYVAEVQRHLLNQADQRTPAERQLGKEELFTSPLDRGLRGGIEALKNLWAGDGVDKAKVLVGIAAAVYLMHKTWKKGGIGKGLMIGLPIAMVANSLYKDRTGKDLMGQWLYYRSKEERNNSVEQFRRRGAKIEGYKFLGTEAGHQAMKQLTGKNTTVSVVDLLAWKNAVRGADGSTRYQEGAPPDLNVMPIMWYMGADANREDAYELAFRTFEALCIDVAALHDGSGTPGEMANQGADIIERKYIRFEDYRGEPVSEKLKRKDITMLDVIISETTTPQRGKDMAENESFVEMLESKAIAGKTLAGSKLRWIASKGQMEYYAGKETLGELWPDIRDGVSNTASNAYDALMVGKELTFEHLSKEAQAAWNTFYRMTREAGITVVAGAKGLGEWALYDATDFTVEKAQDLYLFIDRHQFVGDMQQEFEKFLESTIGITMLEMLKIASQIETNDQRVEKIAERTGWMKRLRTQVEHAATSFVPDSEIEKWILAGAAELSMITPAGDAVDNLAEFDALPAHHRMVVYEQVKRRIYAKMIAERVLEAGISGVGEKVKISDWSDVFSPTANSLHEKIYASFSPQTIALLAMESKWVKDLDSYAKENPGWTATPAAVGSWIIDWVQRSDAKEYLETHVKIYEDRFIDAAKEKLGAGTPEFQAYAAYVKTIFTNVVVEVAIGSIEARRAFEENPTAGRSGGEAMRLAIDDAAHMLDALILLRGSSAEHTKIGNLDIANQLKIFIPTENAPTLDQSRAEIDRQAREFLSGNININLRATRMQAIKFLETASESLKNNFRNLLLPHYDTLDKIRDDLVARRASGESKNPERLQFLIDSAVLKYLDTIVDDLKKVSIGSLSGHAKHAQWERELLELFAITKQHSGADISLRTEELADTVSLYLEYVHFGRDNDPDRLTRYKDWLKSNGSTYGVTHLEPTKRAKYEIGFRFSHYWNGNKPGTTTRFQEYAMGSYDEGYLDKSYEQRNKSLYEDYEL